MRKTILVTGGATGIGKACAERMAKKGYDVLITYKRSEGPAKELQKELEGYGVRCEIFKADVADEDQVRALIGYCREKFGRLDALVNSAGLTRFIPFSDLDAVTTEVWEELLQTNLMGVFFCCREAAKLMNEGEGGVMVNIASLAGMRVSGSSLPYGVSKAGVIMMTAGVLGFSLL